MGYIDNGKWQGQAEKNFKNGHFIRTDSQFSLPLSNATINSLARHEGRYILIISQSCPWSHRVSLVRALKGLQRRLPLLVAAGPRLEGYALPDQDGKEKIEGNINHIHELYSKTDPTYSGRATVPLLYDLVDQKIICNESKVLMRGLDKVASEKNFTLYPPALSARINSLNARIYNGLSNAVYRAGLARSQAAYREAVDHVFSTLDYLEDLLGTNPFLCGNLLTESDLQLFATLVRFDAVYATHFRCTRRRLADYPFLFPYARRIFNLPGVSDTVNFNAILEGYYVNDGDHNPHKIIADLPLVNWTANSRKSTSDLPSVSARDGRTIPLPT
ncbi:glutathione S-transferase C-terminal domain-containing protein [Sneathiella aquimaris]|uniref:glutathione S-transferase C-terminal domain-containing protein n=1 Tax=Sneathiella aquimaris TaxID=2599305 RepID=UPI00146A0ABC|nr:glutathione S-transferase C-terminal domain-containing protein [Sneathiella aquimaris]